eukprot:1183439-Prorocentrum_minimum.AAC.2
MVLLWWTEVDDTRVRSGTLRRDTLFRCQKGSLTAGGGEFTVEGLNSAVVRRFGSTLLMSAAWAGESAVAEVLVHFGSNVDRQNSNG